MTANGAAGRTATEMLDVPVPTVSTRSTRACGAHHGRRVVPGPSRTRSRSSTPSHWTARTPSGRRLGSWKQPSTRRPVVRRRTVTRSTTSRRARRRVGQRVDQHADHRQDPAAHPADALDLDPARPRQRASSQGAVAAALRRRTHDSWPVPGRFRQCHRPDDAPDRVDAVCRGPWLGGRHPLCRAHFAMTLIRTE